MPEFEKDEFKFPDESENQKVSVAADEDTVSVEIEDDTPPEDRGRQPMPQEIVKKLEVEVDELDKYSEDAKQKIVQMKKVWHDERRAKEAAAREREEAIRVAQQLLEENRKLKQAYSTGEKEYINTVQGAAELQLEVAKRSYKEALESGDSEKIAEAQIKMNEASFRHQQAKNFKPTLQEQENEVQIPQLQETPVTPDAKTQEWTSKNPWFGAKKSMTAYALGLHEELIEEYGTGYAGTDDYFKRIDKQVRRAFPDYFDVEEKTAVDVDDEPQKTQQKTKPSTVVAPATRSTSAKQIKLSTRQVQLARKLGLTPEQYAREFAKTGGQ